MIHDIIKDEEALSVRSEKATQDDAQIAQDLLETYQANEEECAGMAANMIGYNKRIIVIGYNGAPLLMYNPMICDKKQPYVTDEGCLSLEGERQAKRFKRIKVRYQDESFRDQMATFTEFPAEVIQHCVDHCNGILI